MLKNILKSLDLFIVDFSMCFVDVFISLANENPFIRNPILMHEAWEFLPNANVIF